MRIAFLTTDNREDSRSYAEPNPRFGTAPTALLEGLASIPECEVHIVSCLQQPVASPPKLADNTFYHSAFVPKWGWMRGGYLGCIRAARRLLRQLNPDIVHGQGTERDCALSAVFSGYPNVLTIHGNMSLIARLHHARVLSYPWVAARLERMTIPRSNGVVCITDYTRRAVAALARQTWVVPNAVDSAFFDLPVNQTSDGPPAILCVGNVGLRKNQNAFIRALDPVAARSAFRLIFLGQLDAASSYGAEFLELVRARKWCACEGFADRAKLRHYLQSAAILALPSLEDNCPMAVLEAMAAGVPALASNVGGVPELIQDGVNGLLCDPAAPATFTAAVSRLLEDPAFRQTLAAAARRHARERFHPSAIARRHLEIYQEVLRQTRRP